tara:strand:- start:9062 stop:9805 length:744 start_codon:yes stop_codon:yes gene_type:complete
MSLPNLLALNVHGSKKLSSDAVEGKMGKEKASRETPYERDNKKQYSLKDDRDNVKSLKQLSQHWEMQVQLAKTSLEEAERQLKQTQQLLQDAEEQLSQKEQDFQSFKGKVAWVCVMSFIEVEHLTYGFTSILNMSVRVRWNRWTIRDNDEVGDVESALADAIRQFVEYGKVYHDGTYFSKVCVVADKAPWEEVIGSYGLSPPSALDTNNLREDEPNKLGTEILTKVMKTAGLDGPTRIHNFADLSNE